jgi:hypothetical protein
MFGPVVDMTAARHTRVILAIPTANAGHVQASGRY